MWACKASRHPLIRPVRHQLRVKILYNKKDTALVQLHSCEAAEVARKYLRDCPLYGRTIRVNLSKKLNVSAARVRGRRDCFRRTTRAHRCSFGGVVLQEDDKLTKEYTGSTGHRFRTPDSKNLRHRCAPSAVLHLANLPEGATAEAIRVAFSAFGTYGARVVHVRCWLRITGAGVAGTVAKFKFFTVTRKMALIQMSSVGEAVAALIGLHNSTFGGNTLKVSFSRLSV